uniref:Peptidase S1 domain-containing protein n=1 Tax=Glossina austeni TaxID=7395 RepID=A0A1A9V917_GLOAU
MKKHFHLNIVIQIIILLRSTGSVRVLNNASGRIVGGEATTIDKADFMVSIRVSGKFICGGSLVTNEYVITAAHCVKGFSPSSLTVVGGVTKLSETGLRRGVTKIILPKDYNQRTFHRDAAVLKLSGKMDGNNIGTIELCNKTWQLGDYVQVYGWGQVSENIRSSSNVLRTVTVPLVSRKKCISMYRKEATITQSMFCAGNSEGKDSCAGDSGGPAIFEEQLCGIVSWGVGCARPEYPGVYTSIKTVKGFINKAMALERAKGALDSNKSPDIMRRRLRS